MRAIQVQNNFGDIFNLPCVYQICKSEDTKQIEVWIYLHYLSKEEVKRREYMFIANVGDWLCEGDDGLWMVLSDEEFRGKKNEIRLNGGN